MKFSVPSKALYNISSGVSKVINPKNALAILNNFLITLDNDKLSVTGSDVENALTATIPVTNSEGTGSFCIDARRMVDLLKEMPDQGMEFVIDEETLEVNISCSDGKYELVATQGNQYPEYKKEEDDETPVSFECSAKDFLKGIENTLFAVGQDDFHPQMMGILLDIKEEDLTFVATDTRKLVKFTSSNIKPKAMKRCILPYKPASILKSAFSKDDKITITVTSKSATFESSVYKFNCRFIKGSFPDYTRVIPKNNPYELRVNRLFFLNAVRRVGVFIDPGYGMEKFKITNDHIEIKTSDPNLCTMGNEKVKCEYSGPEIVIGFSGPYLIEICNVLPTEDILIKLSDPSRPGVLMPTENEEGTDLVMLLMPMNVNEF